MSEATIIEILKLISIEFYLLILKFRVKPCIYFNQAVELKLMALFFKIQQNVILQKIVS